MNPRQNDMCGILPTTRGSCDSLSSPEKIVAIREQRGSSLHVGVYERFDRRGGIVGDHGEANAPGSRVEIFGVLGRGLALLVSRSITSTAPMMRILPALPRSNEVSPSRKGISA